MIFKFVIKNTIFLRDFLNTYSSNIFFSLVSYHGAAKEVLSGMGIKLIANVFFAVLVFTLLKKVFVIFFDF